MAMFSSITQRLRSMSEHHKFGDMVPVLDYYVDEQLFLLDPATIGFHDRVSAAQRRLG